MTRSGLSKCGAADPWALDRFVADGALIVAKLDSSGNHLWNKPRSYV
jgi:hypothetical protein